MQRTVRQCVYPECSWEHEETVPLPIPSDFEGPGSLSERLSRMTTRVYARVASATEVAIVRHLDSSHPGWTVPELKSLAKVAEFGSPVSVIQAALEKRIVDDGLARMVAEEVDQEANALVVLDALRDAGYLDA